MVTSKCQEDKPCVAVALFHATSHDTGKGEGREKFHGDASEPSASEPSVGDPYVNYPVCMEKYLTLTGK